MRRQCAAGTPSSQPWRQPQCRRCTSAPRHACACSEGLSTSWPPAGWAAGVGAAASAAPRARLHAAPGPLAALPSAAARAPGPAAPATAPAPALPGASGLAGAARSAAGAAAASAPGLASLAAARPESKRLPRPLGGASRPRPPTAAATASLGQPRSAALGAVAGGSGARSALHTGPASPPAVCPLAPAKP